MQPPSDVAAPPKTRVMAPDAIPWAAATTVVPSGGASRSRSRRPTFGWLHGKALVAALVVLLGLGAVVSGMVRHTERATDNTAGAVITSAGAADVLEAYWPMHEHALVERDLPTLASLSTGAAQTWEQAAVACNCLVVDSARPLLDAAYFVPRQTTYPASFVAEAQTQLSGAYWTELLVFTRARSGAPWLVEEDSGFGPPAGAAPQLVEPFVDKDGFDLPAPAGVHKRALHLAADLAGLWQRAKNTGSIPASNEFQFTGQAGERIATIAAFRQDRVQANGLFGHYRFYVSKADPLVEVTGSYGSEIACQPIRETVQYTARGAAHQVYQDPAQRNWGQQLAPGYYRKVISRDVWQTCFYIAGPSEPVGVLNHDVGGASPTGIL